MEPCCVMGFRGHQDIGFGLKLLFKRDKYNTLTTKEKNQLFTCNDNYPDGPYWWKQVCALCGVGYVRKKGGMCYRLALNDTFMNQIIPIFTLTTAVTAKEVTADSFVVLHAKHMDIYETYLGLAHLTVGDTSLPEVRTCMYTGVPVYKRGFYGNAGFLTDGLHPTWSPRPSTDMTALNICKQLHARALTGNVHTTKMFRRAPPVTTEHPDIDTALKHTCARQHINITIFRHRLCAFVKCLPEYFGGDMYSMRRLHWVRPPYEQVILCELKEHILWFWYRMWSVRNRIHSRGNVMMCDRIPTRTIITGDIHGSIHSLIRIICRLIHDGYMDSQFRLTTGVMWVLLGDYVDYGPYGLEVVWTLLGLQAINGDRMVLLGGNHEDIDQNEMTMPGRDSFMAEIQERYGKASWEYLKPHLRRLYDCIPRGLIMKSRNGERELHFSHGCISPYIAKKKIGRAHV